jgi:putative membrane protein
MTHTHHAALESFPVAAALVFMALVYMRGWVRIRMLGADPIEGWRAACFLLGLFFIWLAMASPLAALDHELLTVHMVQHLLLMTLAPPFIWLGAPMQPLAHGLPERLVQMIVAQLFRLTPVQRLGRAITQPTFCWIAAAVTLIGWHIPSAFMLGMRSEVWHAIEQASFLISGLLFWWPVVRPRPAASNWSEWSTLLYLFLATLPCDILSAFLVFCDRIVYPFYRSAPGRFNLTPLEDQQCAGALMWVSVTLAYLLPAAVITVKLLSSTDNQLRHHLRGVSEPLASRLTDSDAEVV